MSRSESMTVLFSISLRWIVFLRWVVLAALKGTLCCVTVGQARYSGRFPA